MELESRATTHFDAHDLHVRIMSFKFLVQGVFHTHIIPDAYYVVIWFVLGHNSNKYYVHQFTFICMSILKHNLN
jgi:hypothetical protein